MSAKQANGNPPFKISEVLLAFLQLDARQQQAVREQLQRFSDPQTTPAERDRVEQTLAETLQSVAGRAGPVLDRDERLGAGHHELRAQLEKTEEAFSATLARLLSERQLTQTQLADKIGVGQSAIAMLLKRRCRPQRRTLGKLAEALGVSVEELWPGFSTGWRSGLL